MGTVYVLGLHNSGMSCGNGCPGDDMGMSMYYTINPRSA